MRQLRARPIAKRPGQLVRLAVCLALLGTAAACEPPDPALVEPEVVSAAQTGGAEAAMGGGPELVILISIDTLRADRLGLYGAERATSPHLDAIGREGVVFDDASAPSSWTLPSHASLLTGLFPRQHQVRNAEASLPEGTRTLASLMAAAGYATAAVVNSFYLTQSPYGLTREFEQYLWVQEAYDRRSPSTWVTDQAIDWIRERGDRPLFLFVHYYDVHGDYASLPRFEELFVEEYDGLADGTNNSLAISMMAPEFVEGCRRHFDAMKCTIGPKFVIDESTPFFRYGDDDVRHLLALYDAGIRQLDEEIERLFSFLREQALLDETLLIVTSDHGEEFMEHGGLGHMRTQYQELLRVPLLIRGPGVPRGVRIAAPVSLVDVLPTLVGLVGSSARLRTSGLDLAPLWSGGAAEPFEERFLYGEAPDWMQQVARLGRATPIVLRSARRGRFKLHYESLSQRYELYDLTEDPLEQLDIAAREPSLVAAIAEHMSRRYEQVKAEHRKAELSPEEIEHLRSLGYFF